LFEQKHKPKTKPEQTDPSTAHYCTQPQYTLQHTATLMIIFRLIMTYVRCWKK